MEGSVVPKTLFAFGLNYKTAPVEIRFDRLCSGGMGVRLSGPRKAAEN